MRFIVEWEIEGSLNEFEEGNVQELGSCEDERAARALLLIMTPEPAWRAASASFEGMRVLRGRNRWARVRVEE